MRRPVDAERLHRFMRELGREAEGDVRLYFTGGATAVLLGWRTSTIDVDIKMEPESDRLFRALPRIKDKLEVNIELAAPDQFIPAVENLPGSATLLDLEQKWLAGEVGPLLWRDILLPAPEP